MLMAHPTVLRNLLERYETLRALAQEPIVPLQVRSQIDDVSYTLCVTTGTRNIEDAVAAAREQLVAAA